MSRNQENKKEMEVSKLRRFEEAVLLEHLSGLMHKKVDKKIFNR